METTTSYYPGQEVMSPSGAGKVLWADTKCVHVLVYRKATIPGYCGSSFTIKDMRALEQSLGQAMGQEGQDK